MAPILASISPTSATAGDPTFTMTVRGSNFTTTSNVSFGGGSVNTVFVNENTVMATIPTASFPSLSLGGLDVHVADGNDVSNSTSFSVSATSPIQVADLISLASSISPPDLSNLSGQSNPFVKQIKNIQVYRIKDGDTIQGIAQRVSGDTSVWTDIAFINNLRYPFVSNDPTLLNEQNTPTIVLTQRVNPGDTTISINGANAFITEGSVLFFNLQSPLSDGTIRDISDVVTVDSVAVDQQIPTNTKVRLSAPIFNTYLSGTEVDILRTVSTAATVATTGDFILVPAGQDNTSFIRSGELDVSQAQSILGQDIFLDNNGFLRSDSSGDIQTVVGVPNLNQAIRHRLLTELNELDYHPNYGNVLLEYVGHLNAPVLTVLANHEIMRTLLQDPRIKSVQSISVSIIGDTLSVGVEVDINLLNTSQKFNFVLPTS